MGIRGDCPACGNPYFMVEEVPTGELQIRCADCGNATVLVEMKNASVDSRWAGTAEETDGSEDSRDR